MIADKVLEEKHEWIDALSYKLVAQVNMPLNWFAFGWQMVIDFGSLICHMVVWSWYSVEEAIPYF